MGSVLGKRNMLGQNVIIQSIGASSGVIVAGAIFTLPALYILGLDAAFYQIFLSSLFGGLLGIVLLIPFRSYFVKEMHGKYPFPEATATTEVLVSGEKGGAQAQAARRGRCRGRTVRFRGVDFRGMDGIGFDAHLRFRRDVRRPSSRWSSVSIPARRCWAWATSSA